MICHRTVRDAFALCLGPCGHILHSTCRSRLRGRRCPVCGVDIVALGEVDCRKRAPRFVTGRKMARRIVRDALHRERQRTKARQGGTRTVLGEEWMVLP